MKKTLLAAALIAGAAWAVRRHRQNDQSWFWADEWQAGEREATEEIAQAQVSLVTPEGMFHQLFQNKGDS